MIRSGAPDEFGSAYRLLSGAVTPRPIAWVSSRSPDGHDNLAPYSFFNVVSIDPPVLMFSPVGRAPDGLKDTARNILGDAGTGERGDGDAAGSSAFVIQLASVDLAEAMNASSATLDHGESEFEHAGVTPVEADEVDAARVAEAPVAFECELYEAHGVGGSTMILGELIRAHVDEVLLTDSEFDITDYDPLGRLSGGLYADTRNRLELERPD
ncbi:flavin reductase family protein [Halolamina sp.]|jgi:flavin reductase (DIM6/NTAB) family NADH-FMN oxidoreductase RutF|uniref:flavin reductase family protein n=1 Tax=Halolamina sp. TaxID=1940283 RepID=UPI000223B7D4|nr:flavin reductase domain protein FMN-binding protein [halophilic archaeon DL31]